MHFKDSPDKTPPFPCSALPRHISEYICALSAAAQTPPEMAGVLSLGVLAMAIQSRYVVRITPEWMEPLCLYTVAVAPPGERKSAIIGALTRPAIEYEAERRAAEAADVARSQARAAALEKARQSTENKFVIGNGSLEDMINSAEDAERAKTEIKYPYRIIANDITEEQLSSIMHQQGGSVSIVSSDCGIFEIWAGRYKRHPDFSIPLKAYSGSLIEVDRSNRNGFCIESPRLSMVLAATPYELQSIIENRDFRLRGLCGKLTIAICKQMAGRRIQSPPDVPDGVRKSYKQEVYRILSDRKGGEISLSESSKNILRSYQESVEPRLSPSGDLGDITDWGCNLVGTMLRIAGVIHAVEAEEPGEELISPRTLDRAICISDCLAEHAKLAYSLKI